MKQTFENKEQLIKSFCRKSGDTGSPEVQCALFTKRVTQLTEHLIAHPKDQHSRYGLMLILGKRQRLLNYLKRTDAIRHAALIQRLGLRK